jgi:replicative DNA helicase
MTALDDEAPPATAPGRTDDVVTAEREVLASMIASRPAAEEALDLLGPDDTFGEPLHRMIYAAVRWVTEETPVKDPGSLHAAPDSDPGVQHRVSAVLSRLITTGHGIWRTGSAGVILAGLMPYVTPAWRDAAATVTRAAVQRRTLEALNAATQAAARPGFDPDTHGDMIRKLIDDALAGTNPDPGTVTAAGLYLESLARYESAEPPGVIQFPWADLRDIIGWLRPGQLITIAARPGTGKSTAGADITRHAGIKMRLPVILFTMEMSREEVMDRLIAAEAGVLHEKITGRTLDDRDWDRLTAARERFEESQVIIDDTPKVTLAHARARLRGMARNPARLAVFDYLQLMGPPPGAGENRQQEVAALVAGLKGLAREFAIPVVMLCQLNRGPERRQDKRPFMSDARESGAVENDSDIFILLHREDMYDLESPRAGEADLIVAKHRGGRRGTATVGFQGNYSRLVDLAWTPTSVLRGDVS